MPLRLLLAVAAGVVLGAAFEPVRLWPLMPVAVAVLVLVLRHVGPVRGALLGLAFGLALWLTLIPWMRVVGWDAYVALSGFMSLYCAALGVGLALVSRLPWWPLWSAVVWLAMEMLRQVWPFGGFTWGRLAFATVDTPMADGLALVGANGMGFLLALLGSTLAWAALNVRTRPVPAVGAVLAAALLAWLPGTWSPSPERSGTATVAVVQGDVPGTGDDVLAYYREITASHVAATEELARDVEAGRAPEPDFVLWPENSTAVDPVLDQQTYAGIRAASRAIGVPIVVGAMVDAPDPDHVLNQGVVWDPVTGAGDRYTKRHPVPFGEYIPYRDVFDPSGNFGRLRLVPRDMMRGTNDQPLTVGDVEVADAICFDVAYDDGIADQVRNGAELMVVQTSNAMFIHTDQIEQQWAISRLRAIETGKYVVVAAINGISGVVAPDGSVVSSADPRTRTVLVQELALNSGVTPGVRFGPALGWAAMVVGALAAVAGAVPYRRRQSTSAREDIEVNT